MLFRSQVGEPDEEKALQILQGLRPKYEAYHGLSIEDEALRTAVTLSKRYLPDRFLPDKAIDLIDEAAASVKLAARSASPELKALEEKASAAARDKETAIRAQDYEKAARLRDAEESFRTQAAAERKKQARGRKDRCARDGGGHRRRGVELDGHSGDKAQRERKRAAFDA